MDRARVLPVFVRSNQFLLDHPLVSWAVWILALLVMTPSASIVAPIYDPAAFGTVWWIVVGAFLSYAAFVAVVAIGLEKLLRSDAREVLAIRWALGQASLLVALFTLFVGMPQWLLSIALIEAIVVMAFAMRRAQASRRIEKEPSHELPN